MPEQDNPQDLAVAPNHDAEVKLLAARALSLLANRKTARPAGLAERLLMLSNDFIADDPALRQASVRRMFEDGISASDIIDHIIPEVSRLLGQRWMDSDISFAENSIGTARLQELVRALRAQDGRLVSAPNAPKVLLIVPRPEEHTLGIFVAADQLRRLGLSVTFSVAQAPEDVGNMVRDHEFDMIGLTLSGRRSLAATCELVALIREKRSRDAPIVVGGPIAFSNLDVKTITDADYAVSDARVAAVLCGLVADNRGDNVTELMQPVADEILRAVNE